MTKTNKRTNNKHNPKASPALIQMERERRVAMPFFEIATEVPRRNGDSITRWAQFAADNENAAREMAVEAARRESGLVGAQVYVRSCVQVEPIYAELTKAFA